MNAIERLRAMGDDFQDVLSGPHVDRWMEALAAVDALYQAAKARLGKGHADTCSYELDDAQHSNGYMCDCGYDALAAAVRRVEEGT